MDKKIQTLTFTEENAHISDPFLVMFLGISEKVEKRRADKEKAIKEAESA